MVTDSKTGQPIFQASGRSGLRNQAAWLSAGHPYITGSVSTLAENRVDQISFPYVTKSITVINKNSSSGESLRVHFQSGYGVTISESTDGGGRAAIADTCDVITGKHFVTLPANESVTFDVKCSKMYISNGQATAVSYEVFAELTYIATSSMPHLTGSGITVFHP